MTSTALGAKRKDFMIVKNKAHKKEKFYDKRLKKIYVLVYVKDKKYALFGGTEKC